MRQAELVLEIVGVLIGVPVAYLLLGRRARERRIGGSVMAPLEEVWDPAAHRTQIEVHIQAERTDPAPAPGDPPTPASSRTSTKGYDTPER